MFPPLSFCATHNSKQCQTPILLWFVLPHFWNTFKAITSRICWLPILIFLFFFQWMPLWNFVLCSHCHLQIFCVASVLHFVSAHFPIGWVVSPEYCQLIMHQFWVYSLAIHLWRYSGFKHLIHAPHALNLESFMIQLWEVFYSFDHDNHSANNSSFLMSIAHS